MIIRRERSYINVEYDFRERTIPFTELAWRYKNLCAQQENSDLDEFKLDLFAHELERHIHSLPPNLRSYNFPTTSSRYDSKYNILIDTTPYLKKAVDYSKYQDSSAEIKRLSSLNENQKHTRKQKLLLLL